MLVDSASLLAKAGLVAMGLAVVTVLVLIFAVVAGPVAGVLAGAIGLVVFTAFWVVLPLTLLSRARSARSSAQEA